MNIFLPNNWYLNMQVTVNGSKHERNASPLLVILHKYIVQDNLEDNFVIRGYLEKFLPLNHETSKQTLTVFPSKYRMTGTKVVNEDSGNPSS